MGKVNYTWYWWQEIHQKHNKSIATFTSIKWKSCVRVCSGLIVTSQNLCENKYLWHLGKALDQGHPSPLRQWCISPLFHISPCFRKNFLILWKIFLILRKRSRFSSAKISDDLFCLVLNHKFPPYFRYFNTFPPYFVKIILSSLLSKFPPVFVKFTCFLHTLCFSFPPLVWPWCIYASHNARTGRPCSWLA